MQMKNSKAHWENIYQTKKFSEVSWYQEIPETSLKIIRSFNLPKSAKIIDVGGGDSYLVDFLLEEGYENISVLDISAKALQKAKKRLGVKGKNINWIVADITEFEPQVHYDLWHDRAAFHFLTEAANIEKYKEDLKISLNKEAYMILATFSENGPTKCSGQTIKQYSKEDLSSLFSEGFNKITCENLNHTTPSGNVQNFSFCSFQKK
jgi:cyclopropane fatty-acyl-phospholipid synthase-like methyltransferase